MTTDPFNLAALQADAERLRRGADLLDRIAADVRELRILAGEVGHGVKLIPVPVQPVEADLDDDDPTGDLEGPPRPSPLAIEECGHTGPHGFVCNRPMGHAGSHEHSLPGDYPETWADGQPVAPVGDDEQEPPAPANPPTGPSQEPAPAPAAPSDSTPDDPPPARQRSRPGEPSLEAVRSAFRRLGDGWHGSGTVTGEAGIRKGTVIDALYALTADGELEHNAKGGSHSRFRRVPGVGRLGDAPPDSAPQADDEPESGPSDEAPAPASPTPAPTALPRPRIAPPERDGPEPEPPACNLVHALSGKRCGRAPGHDGPHRVGRIEWTTTRVNGATAAATASSVGAAARVAPTAPRTGPVIPAGVSARTARAIRDEHERAEERRIPGDDLTHGTVDGRIIGALNVEPAGAMALGRRLSIPPAELAAHLNRLVAEGDLIRRNNPDRNVGAERIIFEVHP